MSAHGIGPRSQRGDSVMSVADLELAINNADNAQMLDFQDMLGYLFLKSFHFTLLLLFFTKEL